MKAEDLIPILACFPLAVFVALAVFIWRAFSWLATRGGLSKRTDSPTPPRKPRTSETADNRRVAAWRREKDVVDYLNNTKVR